MRTVVLAILFFFLIPKGIIFAQNCESYNRKLFHMLPKNFPDKINCIDSLGNKQGWWLVYKIDYNPPDQYLRRTVIDTGEYVDAFVYGQYFNNHRIGDWMIVDNVHLIYESLYAKYSWSNDTTKIAEIGDDMIFKETIMWYNSDKSISKHKVILNHTDTLCIECNSIQCKMTYKNVLIKEFLPKDFDFEFENALILYKKEMKQIDHELR